MTKAFDKTLETVSELEDAMALVKTEMTISDSHKSEDPQKISALLDQLLIYSLRQLCYFRNMKSFAKGSLWSCMSTVSATIKSCSV